MGKLYTGTSGWAYSTWKPRFYPKHISSPNFLSYYAGRLNSVELNYTFLRLPAREQIAAWVAATPRGFRFAVKAPQAITHFKRLQKASKLVSKFFALLEAFKKAERLGPVLFQLPPNFKCDLPRLEGFLSELPKDFLVSFEFRHASWFNDQTFNVLRNARVSLCLAESDALETPNICTTDFSYFRLRRTSYSAKSRQELAERIRKLTRRGDVFAYFKHEDSPKGALYAETLYRAATSRPDSAPSGSSRRIRHAQITANRLRIDPDK
jgi:uncharacterized protein YecE (DUF72 family)